MKKSKNLISILFVIAVFIGLCWYIIAVDGLDNFVNVLQSVNYYWVAVAVLFIVLYWLLEGLCFYVISKKVYPKQKFFSSFRLAMIGRLFNNITPFSCGDQPAQLIAMKQEGKSYSNGASILLTRFIVYQLVLVVYTLVILILKYSYFTDLIDNFMYLAIIGFAINLLVVIFMITLAINKNIIYGILKFFVKILCNIKIIKNKEEAFKKINDTVDSFQEQINIMKKEKMMIFKLALYTAIEITVFYAITYIIYIALGQNSTDFITIFSAQAMLALIIVYMPTPGAGIAAEGSFYILFSTFFSSNVISTGILFWRILTFYLPIIVGTVFLNIKPKQIEIDEDMEKIEN